MEKIFLNLVEEYYGRHTLAKNSLQNTVNINRMLYNASKQQAFSVRRNGGN